MKATARQIALERLRANGRLSGASRPANVLSADQLGKPLVRQVLQIVERDKRAGTPRCLAPSANHGVLP